MKDQEWGSQHARTVKAQETDCRFVTNDDRRFAICSNRDVCHRIIIGGLPSRLATRRFPKRSDARRRSIGRPEESEETRSTRLHTRPIRQSHRCHETGRSGCFGAGSPGDAPGSRPFASPRHARPGSQNRSPGVPRRKATAGCSPGREHARTRFQIRVSSRFRHHFSTRSAFETRLESGALLSSRPPAEWRRGRAVRSKADQHGRVPDPIPLRPTLEKPARNTRPPDIAFRRRLHRTRKTVPARWSGHPNEPHAGRTAEASWQGHSVRCPLGLIKKPPARIFGHKRTLFVARIRERPAQLGPGIPAHMLSCAARFPKPLAKCCRAFQTESRSDRAPKA